MILDFSFIKDAETLLDTTINAVSLSFSGVELFGFKKEWKNSKIYLKN